MTRASMNPAGRYLLGGTIGNIVQSVKMPDGNIKCGWRDWRRQAVEMNDTDGFFVATVRVATRSWK